MLCKNCEREIGNAAFCSYCGYNKDIDEKPYSKVDLTTPAFQPKPLEVKYLARSNGKAKAALVFAILSVIPFACALFLLLSFIFGIVGAVQSRKLHSGLGMAIAALVIDGIILFVWIFVIMAIVAAASQAGGAIS